MLNSIVCLECNLRLQLTKNLFIYENHKLNYLKIWEFTQTIWSFSVIFHLVQNMLEAIYIYTNIPRTTLNPLSPHNALKHYFKSSKTDLISLQLGFRMKIPMKLVYQYMAIFCNFLSTSNHLHPLQVENWDSNSRLVVDEDDNGKFRLIPPVIYYYIWFFKFFNIYQHIYQHIAY